MAYYHYQPEYRIGDEIQNTAMMKYLKINGHEVYYKDCNSYVSAMDLFPDDLVIFTCGNLYDNPEFNPYNLWFWNTLLQERGIYTSLNHSYDESKIKYEVVFVPVINPEYNPTRSIDSLSAYNTFLALLNHNTSSIMIVDSNKKIFFEGIEHPNLIYSENIYKTFEYIRQSKVFVGSDTGTKHYAGAIKHPRMILTEPDESPLSKYVNHKYGWQKETAAKIYNEPEIVEAKYTARPCCNPKQYSYLEVDNKEVPIKELLKRIEMIT